ncbi:hypothetical protein NDU88_003353 [Pleurodeles waltl]|uniref:Uncharacterized protein n=1 Tax=Pleurodeles waltl TaxID=8319 RepID=A0AAV7QCI8_PLEWA|nr:hypothetical protein NDU88_003353 [Pleurodeles waltl]
MKLWLSIIENHNVSVMRILYKERGLTLGKKATKVDFQISLRVYEEVYRMKAAISEQERDDPKNEKLDVEDEGGIEEGHGMASGPELH